MKSKTFYSLFLFILLISCDRHEPYPPYGGGNGGGNGGSNSGTTTTIKDATADFSYTPITPYAEQKITFNNKSTNAYSYEWDFGNGKTSKEKNPITTFDQGTWTVTFTAWNKDKSQKDRFQKTINVKAKPTKVQLTPFIINSIDYEDNEGRYWDDKSTDGPDVFFEILDSNNSEIVESKYISNVTTDKLPYTFTLSNTTLSLSGTYKIKLKDYDTWSDDVMLTYTFKPSEHLTEYPESKTLNFKEGMNGKFSLTLKFKWD